MILRICEENHFSKRLKQINMSQAVGIAGVNKHGCFISSQRVEERSGQVFDRFLKAKNLINEIGLSIRVGEHYLTNPR